MNSLEKITLVLLGLSLLMALYRLLKGPLPVDQLVAADTLSVILIGLIAVLAWQFQSSLYLDVALVYGLLSFIGTVAIARMIEGGSE